MSIFNEIQESLQKGKAKVVAAKVEEALAAGLEPQQIMQSLLDGMPLKNTSGSRRRITTASSG